MKVFIDCGAYKGQTVKEFKGTDEYSPDCKIIAFEPNPHAKIHKKPRDYTVIKKAVWIKDGSQPFYTNMKHKACQGASLLKEKVSGGLDKDRPFTVETIDFSKWIMDNFQKTDTIILKMDIEGAEYAVLDKMMNDGSIEYINKLYIETHEDCIGLPDEAKTELLERLSKYSGLLVDKEYAHLTYKKE